MQNKSVLAAAEGLPMTRRAILGALPAVAAVTALPSTSQAAADNLAPLDTISEAENPALAETYAALLKAQAEHVEAKQALEWLADEWKHRWPLAPVQILGFANADRVGLTEHAERDIIGRYIYRETAELRGRLSAEFRAENPRSCFMVETPERLTAMAERWENGKIRGKFDAARARSAAENARNADKFRQAIPLAIQYEREKADIRRQAGVSMALCRVSETAGTMRRAAHEVFATPINTARGLQIKAEALKLTMPEVFKITEIGGIGPLIRIAQDAISLEGVVA